MTAYYNEIDPYAARWLQNLITAGQIPHGHVDTRSIEDVEPSDLAGYTQCHFFAGVGVWAYALRNAGWPDDRPVWTGSCPCQPFSTAGKGNGVDDPRHLWPHWYWLISQCRPVEVFGEQVASKDGRAWIDTVQTDLEALDFAVGAADLCAAGVGAPHIRQRLWFYAQGVGHTDDTRLEGYDRDVHGRDEPRRIETGQNGSRGVASGAIRLADAASGCGSTERQQRGGKHGFLAKDGSPMWSRHQGSRSDTGGMADTPRPGLPHRGTGEVQPQPCSAHGSPVYGQPSGHGDQEPQGHEDGRDGSESSHGGVSCATYPTDGFWRRVDWLGCRDGKFRPVEPIHVEMVDGSAGHMVSLRTEIEKEREVNALRGLRETAHSKEIQQWCVGKSEYAQASQVLRSKMHGEGAGETSMYQSVSQSHESKPFRKEQVRGMRQHDEPSRTPQGPRSDEQLRLELDDIVRLLPQSRSLAELHGRRKEARILQALHQAICEAGSVCDTSEQVQEIWSSLGEEAKGRIGMGFDASRWKIVVPFPLASGRIENRAGHLRAYGNAIVEPLARTFIEATQGW